MRTFKSIFLMGLVAASGLCACAKKPEQQAVAPDAPKMLVCYFSATGTTAEAAKRIADIAGADLYEITPAERYTAADLDWRDSMSRSSVEMHDPASRPAIEGSLPDMAPYGVVFIGYPNWWNTHPTIINTFIEASDFGGKTIVPFMTSGGSTIDNSEKELKQTYPDLTFAKGLLMNGVDDGEIQDWLNTLK